MKNYKQGLAALTTAAMVATLSAAPVAAETKFAWYASTIHPYFTEVEKGVDAFAKDNGVEVLKQLGQDWTQDNQNQNVQALVALGYNAISIFPSDVTAASQLEKEIAAEGVTVVDFGQATLEPTGASFAVATDVKPAAMMATEALIASMGGKGNILNVLEVPSENTALRKAGVEEVVAKYPDVKIIQEVADMSTIEQSTEKVQAALAANMDDIDGIIATGYTPTVAVAQILTELKASGGKQIHFFGIDTDPIVLDAIRADAIDGTLAQNPFGHGYISLMLLKLMGEGYKPVEGKRFVNAGALIVSKANVDTFDADVTALTKSIVDSLTTEYLTK